MGADGGAANGGAEGEGQIGRGTDEKEKKKKRKRRGRAPSSYFLRFSCLQGSDGRDGSVAERSGSRDEGVDMVAASAIGERRVPDHLIVMVNGLIGSAHNWRYAAKQFLKKYPQDVIVHCSESNPPRLTFDGVDVMGDRVAEEVITVVKRYPDLKKISFIGHSLGGLVARYAVARLYCQDEIAERSQGNEDCKIDQTEDDCDQERIRGKIAGLEPMNFITIATPHLGSRGHKQVPGFCGFYFLEKAASQASWFLGRTGNHLFLTDKNNGKPPLLLQMVKDCENLKFISALQSFQRRVAYSNVRFDHLVGWSTSSLRQRSELPKRKQLSKHHKYPHIVNVEEPKSLRSEQGVSSQAIVKRCTTIDMEEEMIRSLTKLSWERVDVNFSGSRQRFVAHNTIQVNTYWFNSDGADVILHMIDNFLL